MSKTLPSVRDTFAQQCKDVRELLEFDDVLVEHLIGGLSWIVEDLREGNQRLLANAAENRLKALKNVRAAGSLRPRYETIYNQCVVLLVSYFDASMSDPAEVRALGSAMADFIDTAIQRVDAAFGSGIQTAG